MFQLKIWSILTVISVVVCGVSYSHPAFAVDPAQVEKELKGDGCTGWIHAAQSDRNLYVFTYRNPKDFFDYLEMSLVSTTPEMAKALTQVGRHDKVRIQGEFMKNPSPQKHIALKSLEVVEKFTSPYPADPYEHEAKLPDDLLHLTQATFLVHAVASEGHILVVEYKDSILPIFVKNADLSKGLFRNDLVKLTFTMQNYPDQPSHLKLNEKAEKPIEVLESIRSLHGKPASVEGRLILFPKSPEIVFNVFAVEQTLQDGLKRQYTIVNFDHPEVFTEIRKSLQEAWDRHPGKYVNGRNKLISTEVRVKVTGTFNEVDANQANPQVLVDSLKDVQVVEAAK